MNMLLYRNSKNLKQKKTVDCDCCWRAVEGAVGCEEPPEMNISEDV